LAGKKTLKSQFKALLHKKSVMTQCFPRHLQKNS